MRGDLRVKQAEGVTAQDMAESNVVIFGEPESNELVKKMNSKLPIRWIGDEIVAGDQRFSAADHVLAMVCPNPLNPARYVVLNSGHTFGEKEFRGTNALLFPRLGDWAVLKKSDRTLVAAGLFDETWQLPATKPGKRSRP
jgi:hypothetical protein